MRDDLDLEHAIAESVDRSIPFIDAHHHIWDLSRWPYRWIRDEVKPDGSIAPVTDATAVLGEYKILRQTWTMERLQRDFYGSNVIGTVHIEADCNADDPVEETVWLEEVAERRGTTGQHLDEDIVEDHRAGLTALPRGGTSPAFARGDPGDPPSRGSIAAVAGQRSVGEHEGLLCRVLGVFHPPQDPVAGAEDHGGLPFDEMTERLGVALAGEGGHGAVTHGGPAVAQ